MNILALETSTPWCSVALQQGRRSLVRESLAGQSHSEQLLAMVDALLHEAGISLKAVDGIAYGAGPGSFTGLRIACAVAQGLAFAHALPVTGVGTLRALAAASDSGSERLICCLDARMNEVYYGLYLRSGAQCEEVLAPLVCAPEAVPLPQGAGWSGCGSGFAVYGDVLRQRLDATLETILPLQFPHAREVAMLAAPVFAAGQGQPADTAAPVYVRDRVALKTAER